MMRGKQLSKSAIVLASPLSNKSGLIHGICSKVIAGTTVVLMKKALENTFIRYMERLIFSGRISYASTSDLCQTILCFDSSSERYLYLRTAAIKELRLRKENIVDKPYVVPTLVYALDDPNLTIREEAALTLREIPDLRAVRALVESLTDKGWFVRSFSEGALWNVLHAHHDSPPGLKFFQESLYLGSQPWGFDCNDDVMRFAQLVAVDLDIALITLLKRFHDPVSPYR